MIGSLTKQSDLSAEMIPGYGDQEVAKEFGYEVTNEITMP